jgi:acyl-CoA reductase-like NAD-dependent aldehyde dehydrogenase
MTTQTLAHFINGERVAAAAEHVSENPSDTRDIVARFPDGTSTEVAAAVAAARKAFPAWADASPEVRADFLDRIGDTILKRRE